MFIEDTDFTEIIREAHLEEIIDDHPAALEEAIHSALEEMASYLSSRYDVAAIYAQTGTDRHKLILLYGMDIALYHLHARIDPIQMPEIRKERYNRAIEALKAIAAGHMNPIGLPPLEDGSGNPETGNRYGSDPMFITKY